jgi:sugar phosphate isomerase/epimerase
MAILAHGSDLTLAPTIAPVVQATADSGGTVRGALECLSKGRFKAVQLDAALPGLRPRELSPRARKDLLAVLERCGLKLAGLDLFIPRRHYLEAEHIDRALGATHAAIELAADLGRVPVSVALPIQPATEEIRSALVAAADGHGVSLAVHAEDQFDALLQWISKVDLPCLGMGLDPATILGTGHDPARMAHAAGKHLGVARLSDVLGASSTPSAVGEDAGDTAAGTTGSVHAAGVRCILGQGDLDLATYRVAVDLAPGRRGPVVLDLRGLPGPVSAARSAQRAWDDAAFGV